jgi:hypothetical protein
MNLRLRLAGGGGSLALALALVAGAGAGTAQASTTVALWHMDEPAGATVMTDSSGHGNNGTIHNVVTGVTGKYKLAYRFRGAAYLGYVEVPNAPSLNPATSAVSISLWLDTTSLPSSGDYDLVRKGAYPGQEYKVELLQNGGINCEVLGSLAHVVVHGGSGLNNGAWHHIVCSSGSSGVKLSIDGTLAGSSTKVAGSISNTSPVEIGAHPGSDWYKGRLDEMSISVG